MPVKTDYYFQVAQLRVRYQLALEHTVICNRSPPPLKKGD